MLSIQVLINVILLKLFSYIYKDDWRTTHNREDPEVVVIGGPVAPQQDRIFDWRTKKKVMTTTN